MLGLRIQVHLKIADSVAAVRQERDRLVHLHSLRFEHLEQTTFGLDIVAIYKSEAFRRFAPPGTYSYPRSPRTILPLATAGLLHGHNHRRFQRSAVRPDPEADPSLAGSHQ